MHHRRALRVATWEEVLEYGHAGLRERLLCAPVAGGTGGFAPIQHTSSTGSSLAPAATFSSAPSQANLLIAAVAVGNSSGSPALTMTSGGWTALTQAGAVARASRLFWKMAGPSESATVTAATSTSSPWIISIAEYGTGWALVNAPTEGSQLNVSGTTTTPTVTPTAGPAGLVVCFISASITATWSSQQVNSSSTSVNVEEQATLAGCSGTLFDLPVTGTSGTYQGQATASAAQNGQGNIAVFTASGGYQFMPRSMPLGV